MSTGAEGCWAAAIGGCSGGLSREHLISRSQFSGRTITVRGLPWCQDEPRTIGLSSLVANILCQKHNNELSDVDKQAKRLLDLIEEGKRRAAEVHSNSARHPARTESISGDKLERWLLKTTINIALQGTPKVGGLFGADLLPAKHYVEIAFGLEAFPRAEGLSWVAEPGEHVDTPGSLDFETWVRRDDGRIVASYLRFHGHRLWLALQGAPEINDAIRPVERLVFNGANMTVRFDWSSRRRRQYRSLLRRG